MFHVKHWDRHDGPAVTAVALLTRMVKKPVRGRTGAGARRSRFSLVRSHEVSRETANAMTSSGNQSDTGILWG